MTPMRVKTYDKYNVIRCLTILRSQFGGIHHTQYISACLHVGKFYDPCKQSKKNHVLVSTKD